MVFIETPCIYCMSRHESFHWETLLLSTRCLSTDRPLPFCRNVKPTGMTLTNTVWQYEATRLTTGCIRGALIPPIGRPGSRQKALRSQHEAMPMWTTSIYWQQQQPAAAADWCLFGVRVNGLFLLPSLAAVTFAVTLFPCRSSGSLYWWRHFGRKGVDPGSNVALKLVISQTRCITVSQSVCPFVLSSVLSSMCLSFSPFIRPSVLSSVRPCPFVRLSVRLSFRPCVCPFVRLSFRPCVCPFAQMSFRLCVCPFVRTFFRPSIGFFRPFVLSSVCPFVRRLSFSPFDRLSVLSSVRPSVLSWQFRPYLCPRFWAVLKRC